MSRPEALEEMRQAVRAAQRERRFAFAGARYRREDLVGLREQVERRLQPRDAGELDGYARESHAGQRRELRGECDGVVGQHAVAAVAHVDDHEHGHGASGRARGEGACGREIGEQQHVGRLEGQVELVVLRRPNEQPRAQALARRRRESEGKRESAKPTAPPASMAAPTSGSPSTALVTPTTSMPCSASRRPSAALLCRTAATSTVSVTAMNAPGGLGAPAAIGAAPVFVTAQQYFRTPRVSPRAGGGRGRSIAPGCNLVHFSQCLYNPDDRSHHKGKSHEEHKESVTGRGDCRRSAVAVVLAACGSSSTSSGAASASASPSASASSATTFNIANVKADSTLNAMLPAAIKSAGTIHVATAMPYAPWEMYVSVGSKQATGIDYDLSMAIAARLGIKDSFDQTQFDAIIPSMLAGKEDMVMASMFDNAERQKSLDFVDYATDGYGLIVAAGNPAGIKTVDDLSGKTVAAQSSTSQVGELKKLNAKFVAAGKAPVTILQFPQDADSVLALTSGKAQVQMDDQSVAAYNVKTVGNGTTLAFVNDPSVASSFSNAIVGAGVPKTDPQLRDAVQKALQSLIADGTYASILNKYGESTLAVTSALDQPRQVSRGARRGHDSA